MAAPSRDEIETFYKAWWKENYMQPLNKAPMGLVDFVQDFYKEYCNGGDLLIDNPGLTD